MRSLPSHVALASAAGVIFAGAAGAAAVYFSPPASYQGPDPAELQKLAAQVRPVSNEPRPLLAPEAATPRPVQVAVARREPDETAGPAPSVPAPSIPAPAPAPTPAPRFPVTREDPVKDLALMGVTHESGQDQAWLVNLASSEKEVAPAGGSAFGFTVKGIREESVVLARGGDEFVLRLGEKQIPVADSGSAGSVTTASSEGGEEGGRRSWGGFGGRGREGGSREDFRSRFEAFRSRFGSFRDRGRGSSFAGSSSSSSSSSRSSSSRSSDSGRSRGSDGGYRGPRIDFDDMMRAARYSDYYSRRNRSNPSAPPTSNPQTARRSGARYTGAAADRMEAPDPISNPQTMRRTGSGNTTAFGEFSDDQRSSRSGRDSRRR